jgi:hypothetical protein
MFTPVAIVCDRTMLREAHALRGVLESFALQVDFYYFIQKRQVLDFFAQPRNYAYTIIFCHGSGETAEDMHLRLEVVDQKSGDYNNPVGWDFIAVELTPTKIAEYVQNRDGTLLSTACGSGRKPLAQAFLKSGYCAYIAPVSLEDPDEFEDVDLDSSLVFFITFFYFLMAGVERDYSTTTYTEQEAVEKAAQLDPDFFLGTKCFRRYARKENT